MKTLVQALLLCCSFPVLAQSPTLYTSKPTEAYKDKAATQKAGIFISNAHLSYYEKLNKRLVQIDRDYESPLYIVDTQNLKEYYTEDSPEAPAPIIELDEYYGSPHLFTTVAGLKVREYPSSTASVLGTVLIGTAVPIEFYPYDKNAYVPIPYLEGYGYISAQYLGERPVMNELIQAYKATTDVSEQRKYAERILELGWNSEDAVTQKAIQFYIDFATKQDENEKVELLKMQLEVFKAMPKVGDSSKVNKLIKKKQFGFALNGKIEPKDGFDLDWIHTYLGYPIDESANLEDCALGDYEGNSFFNSAEFITHDLDHTYKLRKMDMLNQNGFIIDNHLLEQYTTETMFLKLAKGLITTIDPLTHTYYIAVDDVLYGFEFRNNELLRIELIYYC
ncbi:SH3 domain-containing protein [Myroides sp. DW712]|uniref:SH3 domain-containing protein n=1 Tax=Myroides sp. DW712 TaxID=3389800 RepID=UPI00397B01AB